jgi:hypothetical protein
MASLLPFLKDLHDAVREEGAAALYQGWGVHVGATTASLAAAALADYGEGADFGSDAAEEGF